MFCFVLIECVCAGVLCPLQQGSPMQLQFLPAANIQLHAVKTRRASTVLHHTVQISDYSPPPFVYVTVPVMSLTVLTRGGAASSKAQSKQCRRKWSLCVASHWNTIPRWGLAGSREGEVGEELEHRWLFSRQLTVEAAAFWAGHSNQCVCVWMCVCAWARGTVFGMTWHLPPVIIPQSRSRTSLWAASCLSPVTPVKRTRGETPPFTAASAIPVHTGGLPECQGRVTMETNQPSTMESRSTGGTCSSYDVILVYWLKCCSESGGNTKTSTLRALHLCAELD